MVGVRVLDFYLDLAHRLRFFVFHVEKALDPVLFEESLERNSDGADVVFHVALVVVFDRVVDEIYFQKLEFKVVSQLLWFFHFVSFGNIENRAIAFSRSTSVLESVKVVSEKWFHGPWVKRRVVSFQARASANRHLKNLFQKRCVLNSFWSLVRKTLFARNFRFFLHPFEGFVKTLTHPGPIKNFSEEPWGTSDFLSLKRGITLQNPWERQFGLADFFRFFLRSALNREKFGQNRLFSEVI